MTHPIQTSKDNLIVHNPAKTRANLFRNSAIEAELKKFGAREITLG